MSLFYCLFLSFLYSTDYVFTLDINIFFPRTAGGFLSDKIAPVEYPMHIFLEIGWQLVFTRRQVSQEGGKLSRRSSGRSCLLFRAKKKKTQKGEIKGTQSKGVHLLHSLK